MKLARTVLVALALVLGFGLRSSFSAPAAQVYKVNGVHSSVGFRVKHLGASWAHGRFNEISGTLAFDAANLDGSSIAVEIKADSVDTGFAKRDQHLKSPDFFNTKEFPTITFKSKKIEKAGDKFAVTGDLTLHGVTKSVTAQFEHTGEGKDPSGAVHTGGEAVFTIKRSDYGMKWGIDNGAVGDDVTITVSIEAVKS